MATATIETSDWLAIKTRVDTLVTDPVMQVFEPGETIPSSLSGTPIILLGDVTNDVDRVGIDPRLHTRSGTLMLNVRWPISSTVSHTQLKQITGEIAAHFPADTQMRFGTSVLRVREDATARQPYVDGAYRYAPVVVRWWNR